MSTNLEQSKLELDFLKETKMNLADTGLLGGPSADLIAALTKAEKRYTDGLLVNAEKSGEPDVYSKIQNILLDSLKRQSELGLLTEDQKQRIDALLSAQNPELKDLPKDQTFSMIEWIQDNVLSNVKNIKDAAAPVAEIIYGADGKSDRAQTVDRIFGQDTSISAKKGFAVAVGDYNKIFAKLMQLMVGPRNENVLAFSWPPGQAKFKTFWYLYYKNVIGLSLMLFSMFFLKRYENSEKKLFLILFIVLGGLVLTVHRPTFYIFGIFYFIYALVSPYKEKYDYKRLKLNFISGVLILLIGLLFYLGSFLPAITTILPFVAQGFVSPGESPER
ncbi:MAG: hypothetical protein G01um101448_486 [Parcubacteria group bacterium Gr01-1014_48]|nr:MAG: hypothetical protein G01um101448_486 [Parcubacteria group bacterium Gr01-1014_48]